MDPEHQPVRPSHPRITSSFWWKLGLGILVTWCGHHCRGKVHV